MAATRVIHHTSFNVNVHEHHADDGLPAAALEFTLPNGDSLIFPLSPARTDTVHRAIGDALDRPVIARADADVAAGAAAAGGVDLSAVRSTAKPKGEQPKQAGNRKARRKQARRS